MSVLILKDRDDSLEQPEHRAVLTMLASDVMWGATVYMESKAVGSIARLYIDEKTGAVEQVEISRRIGKPALFVRWERLCIEIDPLRIHLTPGSIDESEVVKRSLLERFYMLPGFWGMG